MLEEVHKGGGRGGGANESSLVRNPDTVDPDTADAPLVEGSVNG